MPTLSEGQPIPEFCIEPAQVADVPDMVSVHQQAFVWGYENTAEPQYGATREALQAFVDGDFAERKADYWRQAALRGSGAYVARLCSSGAVVGIGESQAGDTPGVAEITGLYVSPEHHRQGIGSALLRATLLHAETMLQGVEQPVTRLIVTRWAYAADFYQNRKRHFIPTGRVISVPEPPKAYGIRLEQTELERDNAQYPA